MNYLIVKDKKKKQVIYFECNKLNGYKMTSKNKNIKLKDAINVNKMVIINPSFINKLIDKNSLSDMNNILDDYIINKNPISNIQVNTLNNSYNCVMTQKANYSAIEPMFYISSDTKHRENNEGGMLLLSDSESNDLIDEILKEDNEFNEDIINYNIYISEIQNIETTLRFDIDFK